MTTESKQLAPNRITSAAIKLPNGVVASLPQPARHSDIWMYASSSYSDSEIAQGTQGFIDALGKFQTREEAYKIAKAAGQIIKRDDVTEKLSTLYTEDLW